MTTIHFQVFELPTLKDNRREQRLSKYMNLLIEQEHADNQYDDTMTPKREAWMNQDHEGWGNA